MSQGNSVLRKSSFNLSNLNALGCSFYTQDRTRASCSQSASGNSVGIIFEGCVKPVVSAYIPLIMSPVAYVPWRKLIDRPQDDTITSFEHLCERLGP